MATLSYAKYGKDNVRLYKVHRDAETGFQDVVEYRICTQLEGDIETSYTHADNSVVVPTDTQKQSIYILAKQNPVTPPELFAAIVGNHFIERYSHIHVAHVEVVQLRWSRMTVDGKPHPHSFYRDGDEKRVVNATTRRSQGVSIKSSIADLLVLKSTGSAFYGYDTSDEYTILKETHDRILSTQVEASWSWKTHTDAEQVKAEAAKFDKAYDAARKITMETFAKENSPSVQNTMYKMSEQILELVPDVMHVEYTLPNNHYFEIDLSWHKGIKNTGENAEVYAPQSDPNGKINCIVSRKGAVNGH